MKMIPIKSEFLLFSFWHTSTVLSFKLLIRILEADLIIISFLIEIVPNIIKKKTSENFEVGRGTYIMQSIAGTGIYTICKQNTCKFRLRELEKNLTKIFELFVFQWIDSRHLWLKWWRWRIWGESLKNNRENIMFIDCFR